MLTPVGLQEMFSGLLLRSYKHIRLERPHILPYRYYSERMELPQGTSVTKILACSQFSYYDGHKSAWGSIRSLRTGMVINHDIPLMNLNFKAITTPIKTSHL